MTLIEDGNILGTWSNGFNFTPDMVRLKYLNGDSEFANYQLCDADGCVEPPPPPPPTTKVVVVPGFLGSWNPTAILSCGLLDVGEWTLNPAAAEVYNPLLASLQNAGFTTLPFYYDWRKYASDSAPKLTNLLQNSGLAPEEKVHLVGHSMGGLVGRAYLEQETTNNKLDKLLLIGSPQKGSVKSYPAWSGGDIWEDVLFRKIMFTLILKHCGGTAGNDRETLQTQIPSVQQFLPVFDYLKNQKTNTPKPVGGMAAQNGWLEQPFPPFFGVTVGSLYGTGQQTLQEITVKDRNRHDETLGNWEDGKPTSRSKTLEGDDTVLTTSSMIDGAQNIPLNLTHTELVASAGGISKILDFLGVPEVTDIEVPAYTEPTSALVVVADPASFLVMDPDGKLHKDVREMAVVSNPKKGAYKLLIQPKTASTLLIIGQFLPNGKVLWKEYTLKNILPKVNTIHFDPANPQEDPLR